MVDFVTKELKLSVENVTKASPKGPRGNEEFFLLLKKDGLGRVPSDWNELLNRALKEEVKKDIG